MVAEIAALVIFVIMFLLIVLDRIPRQWDDAGLRRTDAGAGIRHLYARRRGPYGIP